MDKKKLKQIARIYCANTLCHAFHNGMGFQENKLNDKEEQIVLNEITAIINRLAKNDPLTLGNIDSIIKYLDNGTESI